MKEQYEKQVTLIIDILPFVAKSDVFALKGGTAINFFHLDCPRLSVDIDLHYLPVNKREEALGDISANMQAIAEDIQQAYPDTNVWLDHLTHNAVVNRRGTQVKIEPNAVIRGNLLPIKEMPLSPYLEEKYGREITVPCMAKEELYAGKLCAALQRQHPRDLFDIWLFFQRNSLSKEMMNVFLIYLISQRKPIYEELDPNSKDITILYNSQFIGMPVEEVALEHLTEIQKTLPQKIVASLTDRHRQFLLGFKQCKPDWSLLPFPGAENLPGVRWKQLNLEKMDNTKRQSAIEKLQRLFEAIPCHIQQTRPKTDREKTMTLSPQEQLAAGIVDELTEKGLLDNAKKQQIVQQLAAGKLKPEDWSLLVELAEDQAEGGRDDA